jgi:hypothetical protein
VPRDDGGIVGAEELPADRESAVPADLPDAGALQQVEGVAAGADEDEPGRDVERGEPHVVLHLEVPQARLLVAAQAGDAVVQLERRAVVDEPVDEGVRERAEVDVRAGRDPGGGDRLAPRSG